MAFTLTKTKVGEKLFVPDLGVIKDNVRIWEYHATDLDTTLRDVTDAIDMRGLGKIVIEVCNTGAANPLTDFKILTYPHANLVAKALDINGTTYFYEAIATNLAAATLDITASKVDMGMGFMKIQAKAADLAKTDLDVYITATIS